MGEFSGVIAQHLFLDSKRYHALNNVTLDTAQGTTQIDHVIVSRYGIFVIEAKNMKGWIFGSAKSRQWTQMLAGKKFPFQNPLHQNYKHTKALSEFLEIDHSKLFSVVMFWGDSVFKTPMPENVLDQGYTGYIKSKKDVLFSDAEVDQIVQAIKDGRLPKTYKTHRQHTQSLKKKFESTQTCPKCGKALVIRKAKSGAHAGSQFYGCTGFPSCRFIRSIQS